MDDYVLSTVVTKSKLEALVFIRPLERIVRLNLMACLDPAPNAGSIY